jgi:hypothetical protein
MQGDNRNGQLGNLLDNLGSADAGIRWDKASAWNRLESSLAGSKRRTLPVWFYPAVAAAAIIAIMLLIPHLKEQSASPVIVHTATHSGAMSPGQVPTPVPVAKQSVERAMTAVRNRVEITGGKREVAIVPVEPPVAMPVPEKSEESQPLAATEPAPAKHPSQIVYTLNEIVSGVPEEEMPAKKPARFFRSREAAGTAELPRKRKPVKDYLTLQNPDIIIN